MKKTCIACDERIVGRSDKRFCSDHCRSAHYNKLNSDANKFMRNTNNLLRKNRRILMHLLSKGLQSIHRDRLVHSGFQFDYMTHEYKINDGKPYRFCYEYGYQEGEKSIVTIVKNEEVNI